MKTFIFKMDKYSDISGLLQVFAPNKEAAMNYICLFGLTSADVTLVSEVELD